MDSEMIVKTALFWSFAPIGLGFLVAALCVWLGVRSKRERCTEVLSGKVVGYSRASYVDSAVHLPVVEYDIDGTVYRLTGPRYSFTTVSVNSPFIKENTCEYTTDIYSQNFKVKTRLNSFVGIQKNPMAVLFPLGSEIDVYYDPRKPKRAYVLRLYECRLVMSLFVILGAVFIAAACIAFII